MNHAAYTFRSFSAADWRAMAEECRLQAEDRTCVDCGEDMSLNAERDKQPPEREHRLRGDRWSCK